MFHSLIRIIIYVDEQEAPIQSPSVLLSTANP